MDRYNALVSRHLIGAVIEVGQARGGVRLDMDAMRDWLATLPAKERSNLADTLEGLYIIVMKVKRAEYDAECDRQVAEAGERREWGGVSDGGHCGPYKTCPNCMMVNDAGAEECSACGRPPGAA